MKKKSKREMSVRYLIQGTTIAVILCVACSWGRSLPTRNYYTMNYTPVPNVPAKSKRPYPYAIQIGRFEVQRIFNRQNIMYRFSPHQIQYYETERWAVRPDFMIKDMVFKHLEASNLTNRIGVEFLDNKPDFRIEGTVEALEKLDAGDLFFGHLAMTFNLHRVEDGEQVWNYSFDQRRRVYSGDMVYTVQTLSSILQSQMDMVVGQIDSLFLSMVKGVPFVRNVEDVPDAPVQTDTTDVNIDESAFEIIPEKKK